MTTDGMGEPIRYERDARLFYAFLALAGLQETRHTRHAERAENPSEPARCLIAALKLIYLAMTRLFA
ncbi:hypothetical protein [Saccharopolyspora shandongensis]|uniref:hypothetical protein n=1 Tax=Saccharopolyspora shandongensis TaxID=418495 RepID=UPI0033DB555B